MKKIVAIVALLGIMLQTISQVVIMAEYYAQKDYIARNLCENRSRPEMHCEGKCCLKKKLAKQGKEQTPAPGNQKDETATLFFCEPTCETLVVFQTLTATTYFIQNDSALADYQGSVFRPPALKV
jgi:hypothetical protein